MLLILIDYFASMGIKIPSAFSDLSTRLFLAALTTLLFTVIFGSRFIKKLYEMKTGQSIRVEDCPVLAQLHEKKKNTPTMGGILILCAMILSLFLWMDFASSFTLILLFATLTLGMLGGYDDYLKLKHKNSKGISSKKKFLFQVLISSVIALYACSSSFDEALHKGDLFYPPIAKEKIQKVKPLVATELTTQEYMQRYYIPFYKKPVFILSGSLVALSFFITVFVITGSSNAVNLTDGLDGLAAGCVVMVAAVLGIIAFLSDNLAMSKYLNILYIEGSGEIAVYLFGMIGACLGFIWYNGYPAQVFMGDIGSLALGGVLGVSAILLRREFLFALVGGVFVAEALSVILQVASYRLRDRKRIFLCAPLHHHFEYKGWPETKVVLRFWIMGLILAVIGFVSLKLQ